MKQRRWLYNCILLLVSIVVGAGLLEVLFRLVPTTFMDYRSNLLYVSDNAAGIKLKPGQRECASSMCYKISPVVVNSFGYRDKEPDKSRYDIAVLGDSYMEAAQIPENEYVSRLIERLLDVNVLSAGISGYGTIHEYFSYREYMAKHKPRVVLLFFSGNDVDDNRCATSLMKGVLCAEVTGQGQVVLSPSDSRLIWFKERVRTSCRSCYGVVKLWHTLKSIMAEYRLRESAPSRATPAVPARTKTAPAAPVNAPAAPVKAQAEDKLSANWLITEYFLRKLNEEVSQNGGTLLVVPVDHSNSLPVTQLTEVCRKNNIKLLSLDESLTGYIARFNLPSPYLAYRCDGHWNPLGHFLVANVVAKSLVKANLIDGKDGPRTLAAIDANLSMSPVRILGQQAYSQIYEGGSFGGKSHISEAMMTGGGPGSGSSTANGGASK